MHVCILATRTTSLTMKINFETFVNIELTFTRWTETGIQMNDNFAQ